MKHGMLKTILLGGSLISNLIFVLAYSCYDSYIYTDYPFLFA